MDKAQLIQLEVTGLHMIAFARVFDDTLGDHEYARAWQIVTTKFEEARALNARLQSVLESGDTQKLDKIMRRLTENEQE